MARIFENGISSSSSRTTRRFLGTTALTAAGLALLTPSAYAQDHAWSNFDTQYGNIDINTQIPDTTNITQNTDLYIGNSNNLDILSHQTVNIGQNNNNALFVARSVREGEDPTRILGSLNSNGRVMVIDRNGVFMGAGSKVDVGSIVVSTGDISNDAIINGNGQYTFDNFGDGKIELQGSVTVAEAGLAGFVSPMVSNSGVINAKMGKVAMAGGEKVTLDLYGDNLVEIAVDDKAANALLENAGTINAAGGQVIMTAQAVKDVTDNIINVSGVINASSATVQGGKIILGGGESGVVNVSGTLDASGTNGGEINVRGENLLMADTSKVKVDGQDKGGKAVLWGDNKAIYNGNVSAKGDEGFIETSGGKVGIHGSVELGTNGTWLIDPTDLTIVNGVGDGPIPVDGSVFSVDDSGNDSLYWVGDDVINAVLNTNNSVRLQTHASGTGAGNITLNADAAIDKSAGGGDASFTLEAHNDIEILGTINSSSGKLNVNLIADYDNSGGDADVFIRNDINTNGGTLTVDVADDIDIDSGADITTAGGDVLLNTRGTGPSGESWVWMPGAGSGTGTISSGTGNVTVNTVRFDLAGGSSITSTGGAITINNTGLAQVGANTLNNSAGGTVSINQSAGGSIQAVVDAINNTGSGTNTVTIGAGTYNQASALNLNVENLVLRGAQHGVDARLEQAQRTAGGAGESIIDFGGGARGIDIAANNVTIDGFEVRNNGNHDLIESQTSTDVDGYWDNITVRNNIVHNGGDEGIQLRDVNNAIIENNDVSDTDGDGINIASGAKDSFIRNNEIHGTRSQDGQIYVYDATNITVSGNYIHDTTGNDGIKMGIKSGANYNTFVGNVLNNRISNVGQDGIAVYGSNSTISGNDISTSNSQNGAIHVQWGGSNNVVENNYIHGNNTIGILANTSGGRQSTNLIIRNNLFENNGGADVQIAAGQDARRVTITGNSFATGTGVAVRNLNGNLLNASGNWWNTTTEADVLARTVGSVDITPYLASGVDADGNKFNGFQGSFAELFVTLLGGQTGSVARVQEGVNTVDAGGTVRVNNGTYDENVLINKSLSLFSVNGRDNTTITGSALRPGQGTIEIAGNTNDVTIGDIDQGFELIGFDGPSASERATLYIQGAQDNIVIRGNQITAAGDSAIATEDSAAVKSNIVIDNNIIDGATYTGGYGLWGTHTGPGQNQWNVANVPRQLVALNPGLVGLSFTNNQVLGDAGDRQLVALNSTGATITGNNFDGRSTSAALRVRGSAITVSDNTFSGEGLGYGIHAHNVNGLTIGGASEADRNTIDGFATGIRVDGGTGALNVQKNTVTNTAQDAIHANGAHGITIADNLVEDSQGNGIYTNASNNVIVTENIVNDTTLNNIWVDNGSNATITKNETSGTANHTGIALRNVTGATISENTITNAGYGLYADGNTTGVKAHGNSVTNITNFLVWNNGTPETYDASGNYWGTTDDAAIAAKMGGAVDFTPYLTLGTDRELGTKGFQGDFSNVYVTTLGSQTGATGRITEGVDVLQNGSLTGANRIVNVLAGAYNEDVTVGKSANIRGAQADVDGRTRTAVAEAIVNGHIMVNPNVNGLTINGFTINNQGTNVLGDVTSIYLNNNVSNISVLNNKFNGNNHAGSRGIITSIAGIDGLDIKHNEFQNLATGVYINPNALNVDIQQNEFRNNQVGASIDGHARVRGNRFVGNTIEGLGIAGTADVTNNRFRNNGQHIAYYNGAGPDILLDASSNNRFWFDGQYKDTSELTLDQLFALEDQLNHKMDNAGYGLLRFSNGTIYVTGNTLGIQNAIDAASDGDTIHVDNSTYTENLLIDVNNLKLVGHDTTLEYDVSNTGPGRGNGTGNLITIDADNVNIDPFTLDGLNAANYGVYSNGDTGTIVDGNTFLNFLLSAIRLDNNTGYDIKNNIIYNIGSHAIHIDHASGVNKLTNNWIGYSDDVGTNAGNDNIGGDGIHIIWGNGGSTTDLSGNHVISAVGNGITVYGSNDGVDINGNFVSETNGHGIYTNNTGKNTHVKANNINGVGGSGIQMDGSQASVVQGNTIQGADYGIFANGSSGGITIDGNLINFTKKDGIRAVDIALTFGTMGTNITNNVIGYTDMGAGTSAGGDNIGGASLSTAGGDGIVLINSQNTVGKEAKITGNKITGTKYHGPARKGAGVVVLDSQYVHVGEDGKANVIEDAGSDGIVVRGDTLATHNIIVQKNEIDGTERTGIYFQNVNNSHILGNTVSNTGRYAAVFTVGGFTNSIRDNIINHNDEVGIMVWDLGSGGLSVIDGNFIDNTGEGLKNSDGMNVGNGIHVKNAGANLHISNNKIGINGGAIRGDGIYASNLTGAIYGNTINDTRFTTADANGSNGNGIQVVDSTSVGIGSETNTAMANTITNAQWDGIRLQNIVGGSGIVGLNDISNVGRVGIYGGNINNVMIANNSLTNTNSALSDYGAISVDNGSNHTIKGNVITGGIGHGVRINTATGTNKITGNYVDDVDGHGIKTENTSALTIDGNFIGQTTALAAGSAGIHVTDNATNTVTISNNAIDRVRYGIDTNGVKTLKVLDNDIGHQGVAIRRGINLVGSTNAEVIGNDLRSINQYGVYANLANGLKVYDNDIDGVSNAAGTGVYVTGSSNVNVGNSTQITLSGPWWAPVITVTPRDNRISDLDMGVQINGGNNNNVVNNTISNVHNGVKIEGSTNADVLDNTITGNSVTGIDVTAGSHGTTVDGNTLTTFATGINVAGSDSVTVTDNTLSDVLNGIVATGSDILRIRDNNLTGRGNLGTAINVTNSDDVIIGGYDLVSFLGFPVYQGNNVQSFQNGINANGVTLLKIQGNRVDGTGNTGTGIKVTNSNGAQIGGMGTLASYLQANYVTGFVDGIQSNNSNDVRIVRNTVEDSTGDGIRVDSVDGSNDMGVQVLRNNVNDVGRTGIWMKNQNNALVDLNRVNGTTSFSGIRVEGGQTVTVSNNRSNNTGTHGISANGVSDLDILGNFIGMHGGNIGSDGINVVSSGGALVQGNQINDTAGEGVYLDGSAASEILQNQINNTGSHGVHVHNSAGSFAQVNFIGQTGGPTNINGDGIQFSGNSQGATITGNRIANTNSPAVGVGSGISVKGNVTGTTIGGAGPAANIINDTAWDGIRVERTAGAGTNVDVLNNDITTVGRVGIWLKNLVGVDVNDNVISDTGLSGIRAENGSTVTALRNIIDDTGTHGISVENVAGTITAKANQIGQNIINAILGNGIYVMNASDVVIGGPGLDANLVKGAQNGIEVNNATGLITVDNNTVEDSRGVGILFSGGTNGNVVLKGNKLTNNVTGAGFESGNIDLRGAANIFTGGGTGMRFSRFGGTAPLTLMAGPGDIPGTNGTFGTTVFSGQTGPYIVLANNAFSNGFNDPIKLDASYVTFGSFIPNSKPRNGAGIPILTFEEWDAIEQKIVHFYDNLSLGQILFGMLPEINQEELFRVMNFGDFGLNGLNVRILGLPSIPGGPAGGGTAGGGAAAFNNIAPFAGGEVDPADLNNITPAAGGDGGGTSAQQLNQISTAAGEDEEAGCWSDAINAVSTGQAVSLNYGTGLDDVLNGAANCGSSL